MFWDMPRFIIQSFVSLCEAEADYTCDKDSSLIFSSELYYKQTLVISPQMFPLVTIIFYQLIDIKKNVSFRICNVYLVFSNNVISRGHVLNFICKLI